MQVKQTFVVCALSFALIGVCSSVAKAEWIVIQNTPASITGAPFHRERILQGSESNGYQTRINRGYFQTQYQPEFDGDEATQQKVGIKIHTSAGDLIANAGWVQYAWGSMRLKLGMSGTNLRNGAGDAASEFNEWLNVSSYQEGEMVTVKHDRMTCYNWFLSEFDGDNNRYHDAMTLNLSAQQEILYELTNGSDWEAAISVSLPSLTVESANHIRADAGENIDPFCFDTWD